MQLDTTALVRQRFGVHDKVHYTLPRAGLFHALAQLLVVILPAIGVKPQVILQGVAFKQQDLVSRMDGGRRCFVDQLFQVPLRCARDRELGASY